MRRPRLCLDGAQVSFTKRRVERERQAQLVAARQGGGLTDLEPSDWEAKTRYESWQLYEIVINIYVSLSDNTFQ